MRRTYEDTAVWSVLDAIEFIADVVRRPRGRSVRRRILRAVCIALAWVAILAAAILWAGVLTTCGSQRSRGVGWGVGAGLAAAVIAVGLFALSQRFERR